MSLIFSNLVVIKTLSSNHRMYNLYAKFVKILEICKQFSENLVNDSGNVPRRGRQRPRALIVRSGCSTINCKNTRTAFPISYQGDSSMTAGRKRQACVRNCASGLPWKWMAERNNSLLTPSRQRSVGLQEENVARWGVPAISRKLPTSASVLRRTRIILVISYTLSVG